MFYRLTAIDGCALPAPMTIGKTEYRITEGGLLLEPPSGAPNSSLEGYGILKFFRSLESGSVELVGSSSERYRWPAPGVLDLSRAGSAAGARFSGRVSGDQVELVAEPGSHFVRASTRLTLTASPTSPISPRWKNTFDFGPPHAQAADPALREDPVVLAAIQESIRAAEPARLRAVARRLEAAWRAPA